MVKRIDAHQLKTLISEGAVLVDVRESNETDKVIDGSLHWPLSKLNDSRGKLSKTRATVFYCSSGLRSQKAAEIAEEWTNQDTYTLDGGINEYSKIYQKQM